MRVVTNHLGNRLVDVVSAKFLLPGQRIHQLVGEVAVEESLVAFETDTRRKIEELLLISVMRVHLLNLSFEREVERKYAAFIDLAEDRVVVDVRYRLAKRNRRASERIEFNAVHGVIRRLEKLLLEVAKRSLGFEADHRLIDQVEAHHIELIVVGALKGVNGCERSLSMLHEGWRCRKLSCLERSKRGRLLRHHGASRVKALPRDRC